ncbi:hypothetical protein QOZ80_8BG0663430 [Eleusine coracana subsp. coracana]|nr:hypothetical protein QOZ80_8BG0663430 [Eleusine coracana subsp. coracana]
MDPAAARRRREAEEWMGVAEKLLIARDLEGCKQFVSQALSADPNIPGADDLFAAADVLLAARRRRLPSGDPDPYAVLGLDPAVRASRDPEVVHSHYRRLSLLLNRSHPDRPCSLAFADAARLVADAWAFLSDPLWKAALDATAAAAANPAAAAATAAAAGGRAPSPEKQQHHQPQSPLPPPPQPASPPSAPKQRQAASTTPLSKRGRPARAAKRTATTPPEQQQQQEAEAPQEPAFWTACPSCCHLHKYDRSFEAQTLRCPSCRQPFLATAMVTAPPIVPGTDMYYCSWGFFPLGFPGGPAFTGPVDSPAQQAPASLGFYPMGPYLPLPGQCGVVEGNTAVGAGNAIPVTSTVTAAEPVAAMPEKSSHVKVGAKKRGRPKGSKNKKVVIEIN